jgi:hypothetical protein
VRVCARIAGQNPTASCSVPVGKVAIGGAGRSNWQATGGGGQLLTRSAPGATSSTAASKDHFIANPATLDANCIGIDTAITGVGTLVVERDLVGGPVSSGVGTFSRAVSPGLKSVAGCYGAESGWNGPGRLLFRMSPADGNLGRFTASSKDHLQSDAGTTVAWITRIRRGS